MSYFVFCVFDLKGASREDYLYAYVDFAALGLRKQVQSENGPSFKLPTTAVMGMFDGRSVEDVRSTVGKKVQGMFRARGLRAKFFIVAGADWACAGDST
jgi:hypothetical protein